MAQIKAAAPTAPRLYQHTEPGLLPVLEWNAEEVTIQEGGVLHTVAANIPCPRSRPRSTGCLPGRAHPAALAGRGAHRHPALHRFGHPAKGAGACAAGLSTRCPQPAAHAGAAATAGGAVHCAFARLLAAGRGCAAPASPGQRCKAAALRALTQQKTLPAITDRRAFHAVLRGSRESNGNGGCQRLPDFPA